MPTAIVSAADLLKPLARRPMALLPLYGGLATLEMYDAYSTFTSVQAGLVEGNALMRGVAGNGAALFAVKAGVTTLSIYTAERLWRQQHRGAAILMLIAANGTMALVAAHNARALSAATQPPGR